MREIRSRIPLASILNGGKSWGRKKKKKTKTKRHVHPDRERDPSENDVDVQIGRWKEKIDRKLIMQPTRL